MNAKIAFQGALGAYGDEACRTMRPDCTPLPYETFEDVFTATESGEADFAMLPVENSTYGRVADIHRLLPDSGLHIIGETFVRVKIAMLAMPGSQLKDIKVARGHLVILPQCRTFLETHNIKTQTAPDNAGAAADIAAAKEYGVAALASELAGEIHGLDVIARDIEDHNNNTTRFLLMSKKASIPLQSERMMTSFIFQVRNIPAALYKVMGGFATNGVNMTKIESYMGSSFNVTQFYADIEGHPDDENVQLAMEELGFFTDNITILGTYPAAPERRYG